MRTRVRHAEGGRAMVVSGHEAGTQAALQILAAGGSLADAAVGGAAMLSVVLPQACGLGGDAFMLIHDANSGLTHGLNASGMSPALATPETYAESLPERGPRSCNVPGMVAGWQALHARCGRLDWAQVLQPAIDAARHGIVVSPVLAHALDVHQAMLDADPGSRSLFLPQGRILSEGERLYQASLADTLLAIARDGACVFYDGPIARSIAQANQALGGGLRDTDFLEYRPEWVTPISTSFCGHEIRCLPPNSYGIYLLLQLMALADDGHPRDTATTSSLATAGRYARLIRAARGAFAAGAHAVADPDFSYGADPVAPLLGPAGRVRLQSGASGYPANKGGTAVISVADAKGNAVTIIQSVYLVFGSGVSDAQTGVLLNNRLSAFCLEQSHPNQVGPHKRPAHTLCPAMIMHEGRLRYVMATPGGPGQTLTLAQVMQAVLEQNVSLEEAIETLRWSMGLNGELLLEAGTSGQIQADLAADGLDGALAQPGVPYFGSVKAISLDRDGRLRGVVDGRRDATAGALI